MGANQSSAAGGSSGPAGVTVGDLKTCYYDVLGIDGQASEDEIKKAYRKKALELHPDRNYGNVEASTKQFADVQSAYEVLSDPQERAWYDSHRDEILRKEEYVSGEQYQHNVRITTTDDIMRVFPTFRGKIDFTDSDRGFYTILRGTFDTLAREEELACEWERLDPITYPSFGHADDAYDDVVRPFYAAWNAFATKKSFSWEDTYRYSEAPDRRVRRIMEKENKRLRDEGVRQFNDAVRSLVAFVKKRDRRFKPIAQSEAERQKLLRESATAQAARSRAANQVVQEQQEPIPIWMRSGESYDSEISNETEELTQDHFECVVCKKNFKSEKQYESHEKSRKHVRAVQHLKRQMEQEDRDLNLEQLNGTRAQQPDVVESDESDMVPDMESAIERRYNIVSSNGGSHHKSESKRMDGSETSRHNCADFSSRPAAENTLENFSNDEHVKGQRLAEPLIGSPSEPVHNDNNNSLETLSANLQNRDSNTSAQPRMSKAKAKRAKKATQTTANTGSGADLKCLTCQASFPSKTSLFNHIRNLGHAQLVSKTAMGRNGKNR